MLDVKILSWDGITPLSIDKEGSASFVLNPRPPIDEKTYPLPFRSYMKDVNGSNSMVVNGSVTNVTYSVNASQDFDIYIKYVSVEIGDGGTPSLNKFGSLTALTNGVKFEFFNNDIGFYELHEGIKTNKEFVRIGTDTAPIGTGVDAFLADVSGGGTEKSYLPSIDFTESYGLTYGIRLRKGTNDRLIFTVRDNLTNLTTFNAVCYGQRI